MPDYLHNHPEYKELLRAVEREKNIERGLVEKDYWIMQSLYGLRESGLTYELKGGTSLSKGYGIIHRFSEDIDIRIEPPSGMDVKTGRNHVKPDHCAGRKNFYEWLAREINIDGINTIVRDTEFDNETYFSGGIRLHYQPAYPLAGGLKEGVLLEVGFDDVTPNSPVDISSWALDFARKNGLKVRDNRARGVLCYHPGYTFVEKLQSIVTKFRKQAETGKMPSNFIRHYYDVACLLENDVVQEFIGTEEYQKHKRKRFPAADQKVPVAEHEAFLLKQTEIRERFEREYQNSSALYYQEQPPFDKILETISENMDRL